MFPDNICKDINILVVINVQKNSFGFHSNRKTQGQKQRVNNLYFKYRVCQMILRHLNTFLQFRLLFHEPYCTCAKISWLQLRKHRFGLVDAWLQSLLLKSSQMGLIYSEIHFFNSFPDIFIQLQTVTAVTLLTLNGLNLQWTINVALCKWDKIPQTKLKLMTNPLPTLDSSELNLILTSAVWLVQLRFPFPQ